jgi:hypothetical protein
MKTSTRAALTGVGISVILSVSCSKNQIDGPGDKKKKNELRCDVAAFVQQSGGQSSNIFNKSYDLSGQRLSHIDAGLFSGGAIWTTVHLDISYNSDKIYFISSENSSDTGIVLTVDNAGRPLRADVGQIIDNGFGPQEFSYENGRLNLINIDDNWMRIWFRYDDHGNNSQIVTDSSDGMPRINHEYQYEKNKKAGQQFYLDEARGFSFNVLTMLHAAGFFPELNPVDQRVRSTVHWGPYLAYDFIQKDHRYDKSGRLMQYKTASPGSNSSVTTFNVDYNCVRSNNNNNDLITLAQ